MPLNSYKKMKLLLCSVLMTILKTCHQNNFVLQSANSPQCVCRSNVPFGKNKVQMLEISIEKNCPIKNIPLKKLTEKFPDFKANILGALRKEKFIYLKKDEAKAIVHAHSPHATAVSAHGESIPAFHYMIALAGGVDIKCSEYATFGTSELSNNILKALEKRKACLMSNHGQVAFGSTLKQAFELAEEVENICHQYIIALKIGNPKILSSTEMNKILDKIKHYKKA